jgi:hypothetical protein
MDLLGSLAVGLFGISIAPSFNQPWLVGEPSAVCWPAGAAPAGSTGLLAAG